MHEKGAVFFTPIGGKYAEGANFPGHKCNCVILAGFTYPLYTATQIGREAFYRRLFSTEAKKIATTNYAFRQSVQAGGRCVRDENDLGVVILMDK